MSNSKLKVGGKARLTKRRTGEVKGNAYQVLAIANGKATLRGTHERPDKRFDLRDLS